MTIVDEDWPYREIERLGALIEAGQVECERHARAVESERDEALAEADRLRATVDRLMQTDPEGDAAMVEAGKWSAYQARIEQAESERDTERTKVERAITLADAWAEADGEPATRDDLTALTIANCHGAMLRHALEADR